MTDEVGRATHASQLALIPREELQRALGVAKRNLHEGIALLAAAVVSIAISIVVGTGHVDAFGFFLTGGGIMGVLGISKSTRATLATSTIRKKLAFQDLPSARLLH